MLIGGTGDPADKKMTIRARNRILTVAVVVAAIAIVVSLLPMIASTGNNNDDTRDVRLVIRDMAFYLDGKGEPNPTLTFRAGERVRLTVVSEDAGMDHDFTVRNWKVATKTIEGRGEDDVTIRVPKIPGTDTYFCTPHAAKMRGMVVVE